MVENIPQGYKKTDVGVIPIEWDVCEVQDAYDICNNLRLPISGKIRKNIQGQYPYYGPTKIQDYINQYRLDGEYALIGEDGDHFLKWTTMPMTLLVTGRFNVNNHAHVIKGIVNETKWFYWYFYNKDMTPFLTRQGAGRYKLSKATLKFIKIPIPPRKEQKVISKVLSDIDSLISSLKKLIKKKQDIKKGAMQELLTGKKRLSGFTGEWNKKELGEIANIVTGNTPPTSDSSNYGNKYLFVSPADLGINKYILKTNKKLSEKGFSISKKFPKESILFTCIGSTIGKLGIASTEVTSNQQINAIFPNSNYSTDFIYYMLSYLASEIKLLASEQAVPIINKSTFGKIQISFPDILEQKAIAQVLSDIDEEIEKLNQELNKYKKIKHGMMQELLTGKRRLI